jgi:DNA-binding Xre family transcriptional regulator
MSNINLKICDFITREWLFPWLNEGKSQSSFADSLNIDESTIRKIKSKNGYRIPVETLYKICEAKNIKLSEFFQMVGV